MNHVVPLGSMNGNGRGNLHRIYVAALFFAVHIVLITYVHSTYLEQFVPERVVGILYAIGALIGIATLSRTPHILRRIGNKKMMLVLGVLEVVSLCIMTWGHNVYAILAFFAIHQATIPILFFNFDIFIKHFSTYENTGTSRGTFLSIVNVAYVIVPLVMGFLLSYGSFPLVYGLSMVLVVPLLYLIYNIHHFQDSHYHDVNLIGSLKESYRNPDIFRIVIVNLILQMFYATMVIYMPILLHQVIGFEWSTIGIMFTIMLTPFVIFEFPLGKISDSRLGEKELLISGLVMLAVSTAVVPFLNSKSAVVWTILLFLTRVGASFVEIMAESYFFKKVNDEDANLLSLWRATSSMSYAIIPAIVSLILFIINPANLGYVFFLPVGLALIGIFFASKLKDTL